MRRRPTLPQTAAVTIVSFLSPMDMDLWYLLSAQEFHQLCQALRGVTKWRYYGTLQVGGRIGTNGWRCRVRENNDRWWVLDLDALEHNAFFHLRFVGRRDDALVIRWLEASPTIFQLTFAFDSEAEGNHPTDRNRPPSSFPEVHNIICENEILPDIALRRMTFPRQRLSVECCYFTPSLRLAAPTSTLQSLTCRLETPAQDLRKYESLLTLTLSGTEGAVDFPLLPPSELARPQELLYWMQLVDARVADRVVFEADVVPKSWQELQNEVLSVQGINFNICVFPRAAMQGLKVPQSLFKSTRRLAIVSEESLLVDELVEDFPPETSSVIRLRGPGASSSFPGERRVDVELLAVPAADGGFAIKLDPSLNGFFKTAPPEGAEEADPETFVSNTPLTALAYLLCKVSRRIFSAMSPEDPPLLLLASRDPYFHHFSPKIPCKTPSMFHPREGERLRWILCPPRRAAVCGLTVYRQTPGS